MNQKGVANIIFIVVAVVLAIAAVGYIKLVPWQTGTLPIKPPGPAVERPIEVEGIIDCLPHKTDSTEVTMACAIGLFDQHNGTYYGLDNFNQDDLVSGKLTMGMPVYVQGAFTPNTGSSPYNIVGTIRITYIWQQADPPTSTPTPVPSPTTCTSDAHCPSARYICEATVGIGTVCPSDDPYCISTSTIVEGVCKLKEGSRCQANSDCAEGRLCYANICTNPTGNQCGGPNDTNCPSGYECVQGCGSPAPRLDDPPPPYYCKLKGHVQMCPICLSKNTLIDTPSGAVPVQQLKGGMAIWTANEFGERVPAVVINTTETPVPPTHQVVHLVLTDGRNVFASPEHPTADGRIMGNLVPGDIYDGARIETANRMSYKENATYDVLPSGKTGFYWANGILLGSTLR